MSIEFLNTLKRERNISIKHLAAENDIQVTTWQGWEGCITAKFLGKQIGKITELCMGPPYPCSTLVHQYGGKTCLREEKKILLSQSCTAPWNALVTIFNCLAKT